MTNKKETRHELELTVLNDFIEEITRYRDSLLEEVSNPRSGLDAEQYYQQTRIEDNKKNYARLIDAFSNKLKKIAVFSDSMTGLI